MFEQISTPINYTEDEYDYYVRIYMENQPRHGFDSYPNELAKAASAFANASFEMKELWRNKNEQRK